MFPFFKQKEENKQAGEQNAKSEPATHAAEPVETELSIPNDWKFPPEQRYVYAFHNSDAGPLQPDQLSLLGVDVEKREEQYVFSALIRHSLNKTVQLQQMPILLLGPDNQVLGRKVFDLSKAGAIPARSSRPWQFAFSENELKLADEVLPKQWSLAFELRSSKPGHQLDLEDSWKASLDDKAITDLKRILADAPALEAGEVNFTGIQAKFTEEEELAVTLLIRNGSDENLLLKQLSLKMEDASGKVVAKGNFSLKKLTVKAHTSKPWTFVFPSSTLLTKNPDLSAWKVYPADH